MKYSNKVTKKQEEVLLLLRTLPPPKCTIEQICIELTGSFEFKNKKMIQVIFSHLTKKGLVERIDSIYTLTGKEWSVKAPKKSKYEIVKSAGKQDTLASRKMWDTDVDYWYRVANRVLRIETALLIRLGHDCKYNHWQGAQASVYKDNKCAICLMQRSKGSAEERKYAKARAKNTVEEQIIDSDNVDLMSDEDYFDSLIPTEGTS